MRERVRERHSGVGRERYSYSYRYDGDRYRQNAAVPATTRGGARRPLNWREHEDVSSFYFTRFPEDIGEEELWDIFKKWGDVREVFIAKNRNRGGRRYGFVRFKGVRNILNLERALDNLIIGGLKLHANIPKHEREGRIAAMKGKAVAQEKHHQGAIEGRAETSSRYFQPNYRQPYQRPTYAQVVAKPSHNLKNRWYPKHVADITKSTSSTIQLDVQIQNKKWLQDAWVGRLSKLKLFDRLQDKMGWDGEEDIKSRYFGEDMVLLMGLSDSKAQAFCRGEEVLGLSVFHSLEKWKPSLKPAFRLVWVLCWGIPLHAWDSTNLTKIVATIGDLVEVDDDTDDLQRLDRARVMVMVPSPFLSNMSKMRQRRRELRLRQRRRKDGEGGDMAIFCCPITIPKCS